MSETGDTCLNCNHSTKDHIIVKSALWVRGGELGSHEFNIRAICTECKSVGRTCPRLRVVRKDLNIS